MAVQSIQFQTITVGISHEVIFAGKNVRLAGQIDYPNLPIPNNGYPLLFIIPDACSTNRQAFNQQRDMAIQAGYAVFLWDKRGTGRSASGGVGCAEQDTIHAYKTAIGQADIDRNRVVIFTQTDASLLLETIYDQIKALQSPLGIILAGNMLDEKAILKLDTRIHCVTGDRDWNIASRYAINVVKSHENHYRLGSDAYIAQYADRKLTDTRNNMFHAGAEATVQNWLGDLCPISMSI